MFFPDSFGNESMPEMFNRLQRFLQNIHLEHRLMRSNQDLVGFFTCIPAEHIEDAVRWMIERYKTLRRGNHDMVFTVFPKEKEVKLRGLSYPSQRHPPTLPVSFP